MTQQELTKKIIRNAKQQAKDVITAAEQRATEQIESAQKQANQRCETAWAQGQAKLAYRKLQQQRAHDVALIKAQINAKQAWIDRAFANAREKLYQASAQEIQTLVKTYTTKYAHPGDKITIAKNWSHALPDLPTTTASINMAIPIGSLNNISIPRIE